MKESKPHPYSFITQENFETIRLTLAMGLKSKKTPAQIALLVSKATGLPTDVCMGIVQLEFLEPLKQSMGNGDKASS